MQRSYRDHETTTEQQEMLLERIDGRMRGDAMMTDDDDDDGHFFFPFLLLRDKLKLYILAR